MKNIIIRSDGNSNIGSGHIMRCLSLSAELIAQGNNVTFVSRNITSDLIDKIQTTGCQFIKLNNKFIGEIDKSNEYATWLNCSEEHDANDFIQTIPNAGLIIVDHYGLSSVWESKVKTIAPIFAIDDLSNRKHDCKFLLDTTFGKNEADYKDLVPNNCQMMIGSDYALLRPEFRELRNYSISRRLKDIEKPSRKKNILISMGGVDQNNVTAKIVSSLGHLKIDFKATIILGSGYQYLEELKSQIKSSDLDIELLVDVTNMGQKTADADICIGASGSTTWERCCLGLPTINIITANNQKNIARILSSKNILVDGGMHQDIKPKQFAEDYITPLLTNNDKITKLSNNCAGICDGYGVLKVIQRVLTLKAKDKKEVYLRPATENDIKTVFDWQLLPETRKYARNKEAPTWEGHQKWMKARLSNNECYFHIIMHNSTPAGVTRIDKINRNNENNAYEISIFISPDKFKLGIAGITLKALENMYKEFKLYATVFDDNKASKALFTKNGYKLISKEFYTLNRSQRK